MIANRYPRTLRPWTRPLAGSLRCRWWSWPSSRPAARTSAGCRPSSVYNPCRAVQPADRPELTLTDYDPNPGPGAASSPRRRSAGDGRSRPAGRRQGPARGVVFLPMATTTSSPSCSLAKAFSWMRRVVCLCRSDPRLRGEFRAGADSAWRAATRNLPGLPTRGPWRSGGPLGQWRGVWRSSSPSEPGALLVHPVPGTRRPEGESILTDLSEVVASSRPRRCLFRTRRTLTPRRCRVTDLFTSAPRCGT